MVNMAETESMFLSAGRLPVNGVDPMSDDSDIEATPMLMPPYQSQSSKRNKRKNFQPRNITYCEEGQWKSGDEDYALDLSGAESYRKRPKTDASSGDEMTPAPMDLSSKPRSSAGTNPSSLAGGSDSDISSDSEHGSQSHGSARQYLFQQAFLGHQPAEASDLKEYARNTVKELLEIYGLNSAEVAESITNNVPIANFSSGTYLVKSKITISFLTKN